MSSPSVGSPATGTLAPAHRFVAFDGLRAVAVLLVFAHHLMARYVPGGWIGVNLFFALSGFLITSLLLAEYERRDRIDLRAFFVRRGLRLVPALVLHVAVVAPLAIWAGLADVVSSAIAALTYTMDVYAALGGGGWIFSHTWSLAVEEQFYLIWPVLLVVGLRRGWALERGLLVAGICGVVIAGVVATTASPLVSYALPFPHLPMLLGGAALAFAMHRGADLVARLRTVWIPVSAAAVVLGTTFLIDQKFGWLYYGPFALMGIPLVLLIGHLTVTPDGGLARVLSLRPLVWLGERSYGFYLWHFPISVTAHSLEFPKPVSGLLALVASLVATELSWRLVERPFLRIKKRHAVV